jgi:predicted nuclease with TOPRIM domain
MIYTFQQRHLDKLDEALTTIQNHAEYMRETLHECSDVLEEDFWHELNEMEDTEFEIRNCVNDVRDILREIKEENIRRNENQLELF